MGKTNWRTAPTVVEKAVEELWVGVKGQTNLEIAGSLRNIFRYGLSGDYWSRALNGLGGLHAY